MNKLHFGGLKNIAVPEGWTEKALAFSQQKEPEPYRISPVKSAMIAASFVLVAALSISAFFFFGNKNALSAASPVTQAASAETAAPSVQSTETQKEEEGVTEETEAGTTSQTPPTAQPQTQMSSGAQGEETVITVTTITTTIEEPEEGDPKDPSSDGAAQPAASEETQDSADSEIRFDILLEKTYERAPSSIQNDDYDSSDSVPGHAHNGDESDYGFCLIYDEHGNLMGEAYEFDDQHRAVVEPLGDSRYKISYRLSEKGLVLTEGVYRYILLNSSLEIIDTGWIEVQK